MASFSSSSPPCPSGGRFYACPTFLGCCAIETCSIDLDRCPTDELKPASFNATYSGSGKCHTGSWMACQNTTLSFMGCCKSDNHCASGCPPGDLTPGHLSDQHILVPLSSATATSITNPERPYALFTMPTDTPDASGETVPGTSTAQGFATSASVPDSVPAAITTGQSGLQTAKSVPRSNTAAIAGGVVGGIVGLAFLVALLAIYCRRRFTRPPQDIDDGRTSTLGTGNVRALRPNNAELEEIKQGPSPTPSPLRPPSPALSPLPPPPAYTPYRSQGDELNRSPDRLQLSASPPYPPHDRTSSESPPSPPPLEARLSQHSAERYSEEQSVSPISSHYPHQPFGDNGGPDSSMYPEVPPSELLHTHGMRS